MNTTLSLTEGASQTEDDIKLVSLPQAWKILIVVFMNIVLVLTVIGNVVVVVVICIQACLDSLRTRISWFLYP